MTNKANRSLIGTTVVLERIGEPPCEAIVVAVNEITGLVETVRVKDKNGVEKLVTASGHVIRLIAPLREIWLWVKSIFRRKG